MKELRPHCARPILTATLAIGSLAAAYGQTILAESHFDSTLEGWTVAGDPASGYPRWEQGMGCAPGCMRVVDAQQGVAMMFHAPPAYRGDQSAAYNGALRYCIRNDSGGPSTSKAVVVMEGAGLRLSCRAERATSQWQTVTVALHESAVPPFGEWYLGDLNGPRPTRCQFQTVLRSLESLQIRAEYRNGADDIRFDEVYLEACSDNIPPTHCGLDGDLNCDGALTVSDIAGFALALAEPSSYAALYPDCMRSTADINCDGFVTVSDIGPFVALLTGG